MRSVKKYVFSIIIFTMSSLLMTGCSKDEVLGRYNDVIQSVGNIELTGDIILKGDREYGVDHYVGSYEADYKIFSGIEYLFGGTSIERESGKDVSVSCSLMVTNGTAKIFWISGSNEPAVLLEAEGDYCDTIMLPDGGNYIGVNCDSFTGSVNINIE